MIDGNQGSIQTRMHAGRRKLVRFAMEEWMTSKKNQKR